MSHDFDEERLGTLLRMLSPAPGGWVEAAKELPAARRALDELVARAERDLEFRATVIENLEVALEQAGVEPDRRTLTWLEQHLRLDSS